MAHIFRVGEITRALKDVIEGQFPFVWVRGQVSNLARPSSGHVYFSLKDEQALLNVVWFKGAQSGTALNATERFDPLTGEVLEGPGGSAWLTDGQEVLCAGRLTVYEPRGAYQMVAELVQDMGLGRLHLEFEALKRTLAALGWFDAARKRPLPVSPSRVAVVTAPSGAAVRDFLRVGEQRGTGAQVRIHPVLVQGEAAPEQIVRALETINAQGWAQVAVLIRGGGSIEDLWAFNTEAVAGAILRSDVPVLCGVGHEVDVTIADMVADVRAATPSHAAQLLWPERAVLAQRLDEAGLALERSFRRWFAGFGEALARLEKALGWLSPEGQAGRFHERLEGLTARLELAGGGLMAAADREVKALSHRLSTAGAALPGRVESGLDALAGRLARSASGLTGPPTVRLENLERRLRAFGPTWLDGLARSLESLEARLGPGGRLALERADASLELAAARLEGVDPSRPLERGYALARKADGTYLRSAGEVSPGETLDIVVRDGEVSATVTDVTRTPPA